METLDKHFRHVAAAAFKAHGFAAADLLSHWPEVVGETYAKLCRPERLRWPKPDGSGKIGPAALAVKAAPGRGLEVQYAAPALMERINQFLGFAAIAKIKVLQDSRAPEKPAHVEQQVEPQSPPPQLAEISDPALRDALTRLGQAVHQEKARLRSPQEKEADGTTHQH